MLKKSYLKNGKCRVIFSVPAEVGAEAANLCGTFNGWDREVLPMKRLKDGGFSVSITVEPGEYAFRYFLDGGRWENDWKADAYRRNMFNSEDSIVRV